MDQLTIMRSFISVTKTGSFRQTARDLGISGSLVSRHIAELERTLGVRLLNRTTRTVSLTNAGTRYAKFSARIIDDMEQEQLALSGMHDRAEGPLAVVCPKWIGNQEVIDAIIAFTSRYPKIHLRLDVGGMTGRAYDFIDQGYDVALHTHHAPERNLVVEQVARLDFTLCASPGYLQRAGRPTRLAELTEHDCIVNTEYHIWHLQHAGRDVHLKVSDPVYASNTYLTLRKAALADRGIALLPLGLVARDLADGSLVGILPDSEVQGRHLYALHLPDDQIPARVRLFIDFLTSHLHQEHAVPALSIAN